jgi:hypothetical protein
MAPWPYKTLITLISNSKFEMRGLRLSFFIECALCWLAGWCMASLGAMLLHHTPLLRKIHEFLLMRSPTTLLKSSWIPNSPLKLFICSTSLLLLLLLLPLLYYC